MKVFKLHKETTTMCRYCHVMIHLENKQLCLYDLDYQKPDLTLWILPEGCKNNVNTHYCYLTVYR